MIEVSIHGHSGAQVEGGQKALSWSRQIAAEIFPEGTGTGPKGAFSGRTAAPRSSSGPALPALPADIQPLWRGGRCLVWRCGVLAWEAAASSRQCCGYRALDYNTCLFFKNVAIPFKSGPWTGSKDSSRTSPCGTS